MYELTMLSVRLPLNSKLLIVKFGGKQKLYEDFQLHLVGKDQLYYTAMKKTKTQSTISFNMGKSHRHNVEQKKAETKLQHWYCYSETVVFIMSTINE